MKINLDDPNLTAYALGELSPDEAAAVEKAVAQSPEACEFVRETRELAGLLRAEFRDDLATAAAKPFNILPLPAPRSFWSDARWMSIGLAALLAVGAVVAAILLSDQRLNPLLAGRESQSRSSSRPSGDVQMEVLTDAPTEPNAGRGFAAARSTRPASDDRPEGNPFILTATNPRSTFPLTAETASYSDVRRFIEQGSLPPKEAVSIEGMINYFTYDYPQPEEDQSVSINLEVAGCPWQQDHRLVRIGLQGREALAAVAKDLTVEVEFNPTRVTSYRLIGYERRDQPQDKPGGETEASEAGAAQAVTALYEVVPVSDEISESFEPPELLTFKLHTGGNEMTRRALVDNGAAFEAASADLKFAAAVAEFGMILRHSPHKGDGTFASVAQWANAGRGRDSAGYRDGFITLVQKAEGLAL